jgi:hypothetical protein
VPGRGPNGQRPVGAGLNNRRIPAHVMARFNEPRQNQPNLLAQQHHAHAQRPHGPVDNPMVNLRERLGVIEGGVREARPPIPPALPVNQPPLPQGQQSHSLQEFMV